MRKYELRKDPETGRYRTWYEQVDKTGKPVEVTPDDLEMQLLALKRQRNLLLESQRLSRDQLVLVAQLATSEIGKTGDIVAAIEAQLETVEGMIDAITPVVDQEKGGSA